MTDPHADLRTRLDLALHDLAELDEQLDAGEVNQATADRLRARYEADAAAAMRELEGLDAAEPHIDDDVAITRPRHRTPTLVGSLALIAAVAATMALPGFVGIRPEGGFVTGNEVVGDGRDLSRVSNEEMEQVVAANPDVMPMRLRLAHRYLDAGEPRKAFEHYMAVLDRQPDPEAMSHLGWIVFEDGDADLALQLLDASRELAPDEPETVWFLANVHLYGRGDAAAALPLLEQLVTRDDLGSQRAQVEQALAAARSRQATLPDDDTPG